MNAHAARQAALWGTDPRGWTAHSRRAVIPLYERALERLAPAPGERVLDAGCDAGLLAVMAARRGASVTGLDVSASWCATQLRGAPDPSTWSATWWRWLPRRAV
jgi:2-polyprenyl-3-methyl-5-hydroxy-6-metoxy-1,4-benzoquinol methylase